MSRTNKLFLKSLMIGGAAPAGRRGVRPGMESADNQQDAIAQFEPIERKKEGFHEGEGVDRLPIDGQLGEGNTLRENDDVDHVGELQEAAEAIAQRISTARRHKAALEELAEQLESTLPEGGVSEQTASMVQTALGASDIPEVQDVVAVESFAGDRGIATANLANTFRARANAMGRVIDNFQRKVLG